MAYLVNNGGVTTLAAGITTTTQTAITLAAGHGVRFPSPTGGDYTLVTVDNGSAVEIICIVGRSTDTLTVGIPGSASADSAGRGQENTTAATWASGSIVEGRATAAIVARGGNAKTAAELAAVGGAALIGNTAAGGISASTVQAAINELDTEKARIDTLAAVGGAALIGNTAAGGISATTVQAAINELDTEKARLDTLAAAGGAALIGNTAAGNIVATTVQAAINELDTEKAKLNGDATVAFSASTFTGDLTGNSSGTAANVTGTVAIANGGTGQTTAALAGAALGAIGAGQTWQNLTGSRSIGTTYTNSTGRPICVYAYSNSAATLSISLTVGGVVVSSYATGGSGVSSQGSVTGIVPDNTNYVVNLTGPSLAAWSELR